MTTTACGVGKRLSAGHRRDLIALVARCPDSTAGQLRREFVRLTGRPVGDDTVRRAMAGDYDSEPGRGGRARWLSPEEDALLTSMITGSYPAASSRAVARLFAEKTGRRISRTTVEYRASRLGLGRPNAIDPATRAEIDEAIRRAPGATLKSLASSIRRPDGRPVSIEVIGAARRAAGLPHPGTWKPRLTAEEAGTLRSLLAARGDVTPAQIAASFRAITGRGISTSTVRSHSAKLVRKPGHRFTPAQSVAIDRIIREAGPGDTARKLASRFLAETGRTVSEDHVRQRRMGLGFPYIKLDGELIGN